MKAFIDEHRERFEVEPICRVPQVAPSMYWRHAARQKNPALRCRREQRDEVLVGHVQRVWQDNVRVYGADKIWRQLNREGIRVARCTVEWLMRRQGLRGALRGKAIRTTRPGPVGAMPSGSGEPTVHRPRPNQLWVADLPMSRLGRASCTWPSSSTSIPATSWAGASAAACRQTSYWMRWSRRYTPGSRAGTP